MPETRALRIEVFKSVPIWICHSMGVSGVLQASDFVCSGEDCIMDTLRTQGKMRIGVDMYVLLHWAFSKHPEVHESLTKDPKSYHKSVMEDILSYLLTFYKCGFYLYLVYDGRTTPFKVAEKDRYDDGISLYSGEYKMLRYDFGKPEPSDESLIQITAYRKLGCVDGGEEYFDIKFDGYLVQINKGKDVTICGSEARDFDYRYLPGAPSGGAVYTVQVESSASNACAVLLTAFFLALLM